jgi:DNA-directed RNA polymerase subunit N (RpoN/RPB10)
LETGKPKTNSQDREMITVILCMNCGKVLADKWRIYQQKVKELKGAGANSEMPYYMDGKGMPDTPEGRVLNELGLKRICCRKHFLTQKDLIDKI